jgi:hypothetical protein
MLHPFPDKRYIISYMKGYGFFLLMGNGLLAIEQNEFKVQYGKSIFEQIFNL